MGRSGGGGGSGFSGGGSSSGGFSGSGQSSGGFSGGGSGGRSGEHSYDGGFGFGSSHSSSYMPPSWDYNRRPPMPRPHINTSPVVIVNNNGRRDYYGDYDRRHPIPVPTRTINGSEFSVISTVLIVLILVATLIFIGSAMKGSGIDSDTRAYSTEVRTALSSSAVSKTSYYTDEDGDWIHSPSKLTSGLEDFYKRTGVQPYVYILKNGSMTDIDKLTDKSKELYGKLFKDEGHFLLVFCDDGNGSYNCGYTAGNKARQVMDDEAIGILQTNLETAYATADSDEEVFSDAFRETGTNIMHAADVKKNGNETSNVLKTIGTVSGIALIGIAGAGIVIYIRNKKKEQDNERQEEVDKIMNTPLEKFGDTDASVEAAAAKYENDDNDDKKKKKKK